MNPETKTDAPFRVNGLGRVELAPSKVLGRVMRPCVRAIQTLTGPDFIGFTVSSLLATVPAGGWLGSDADEGRAKLR
jgi:hypothetical protein